MVLGNLNLPIQNMSRDTTFCQFECADSILENPIRHPFNESQQTRTHNKVIDSLQNKGCQIQIDAVTSYRG